MELGDDFVIGVEELQGGVSTGTVFRSLGNGFPQASSSGRKT